MAIVRVAPAGPSAPRSEDIVRAIKLRVSMPTLRESLKAARLKTGSAWDDVIGAANHPTDGPKLRQFLWNYYSEHIIAGERYVQYFTLDNSTRDKVMRTLSNATVPPSDFTATYPLPLPHAQLSSGPKTPTLVEVQSLHNGDYALVYCSVRSHDVRETYDFNQLPQLVQKTYAGIDELITVKKDYFQAFDVVVVRSALDRVEICIDFPKKGITKGLENTVIEVFREASLNVPDLQPVYQSQPTNVFDALSGIYFEPKEGTVRMLSFRTMTTGSRKTERMMNSSDDLRSEDFHQAGAVAVNNKFKPYELVVDWESKIPQGNYQVAMHAHFRELSSESPRLLGFFVTAGTNQLMTLAINKIVKFL